MNIGWAFLITWLPTYLHEVRGLDQVTASGYVSIALACSLGGMVFGGWWCDFLTRRLGQRLGRRLPFVSGGLLAAGAYLLCPSLDPLVVAIACGVVAFATDSVIPAVWALAQDIGGSHVASTLAWSNMWGNFGASAVAKLIPLDHRQQSSPIRLARGFLAVRGRLHRARSSHRCSSTAPALSRTPAAKIDA